VPEILRDLFDEYPRGMAVAVGVVILILAAIVATLWQLYAPGPRRRRGLKRVRNKLQQGFWQESLEHLHRLRQIGIPSQGWQKRFNQAEGECLQAGSHAALHNKEFEEALEQGLKAAALLGRAEAEVKKQVQAAMLDEIRSLSSASRMGETRVLFDLIGRTLLVQSPCREASFWQGLCHLRAGQPSEAMEALQTARSGAAKSLVLDEGLGEFTTGAANAPTNPFIDPPLYLGALLLRKGQAKEAMRYLTEANRIDANCPIVTLQLGAAMVETGGDTQFAVRALQRALGPKGLGLWAGNTQRMWVEAFPENRSYLRKLAAKHTFICPVFGGDMQILTRQGALALAQGLFKLGNFQEAADHFAKSLQEGAASLPVLRGLGLSLAKLGKYDEAFKHLRAAYEMEGVKDRLTAGYLALCGAKGTANKPEDVPRNLAWAIRTVTPFTAPADTEWAYLISAIFTEAREHEIPLELDDQLYLCEHLVSVDACDPLAAQAFHHLYATNPKALRLEYAWLFCRAAAQHKVDGEHTLGLFARTFADAAAARSYFEARHWKFDDVEFAYLERTAALAPGQFPSALGPDYPARAEQLLLARSLEQEKAGRMEAALATTFILAKLAPHNAPAQDRLACLYHRAGKNDEALDILAQWQRMHEGDPLPRVRRAVLLHRQGRLSDCQQLLREAMDLSTGRRRADIALLAARLTLQSAFTASAEPDQALLDAAQDFLLECLRALPDHIDAKWHLAAVRWLKHDFDGAARLAETLTDRDAVEPRYHWFAALCRLAAGDYGGVVDACARLAERLQPSPPNSVHANGAPIAAPLSLGIEADYLAGLAQLELRNYPVAAQALGHAAQTTGSPTANHALALWGLACFQGFKHEDAVERWQKLDAGRRVNWKLNETLANTVFLTAVEAFHHGRFEQAAEKLRQAGKLGCRDRRLGPLLVLALFKAGQQVVYGYKKS
jgi:tetratricopeptide (TPR) repeat protein